MLRYLMHLKVSILIPTLLFASASYGLTLNAPRISPEELDTLLKGAGGVTVIDVRLGDSWNASDRKIAGAVRENPRDIDSWMETYPKDRPIVLYCS